MIPELQKSLNSELSRVVVLGLGMGNLQTGFPRVCVQIRNQASSVLAQFVASLPPEPALIELYQSWKLVYQSLCQRHALLSLTDEEDEEDDEDFGDPNDDEESILDDDYYDDIDDEEEDE